MLLSRPRPRCGSNSKPCLVLLPKQAKGSRKGKAWMGRKRRRSMTHQMPRRRTRGRKRKYPSSSRFYPIPGQKE